jgi:hypothetical protein
MIPVLAIKPAKNRPEKQIIAPDKISMLKKTYRIYGISLVRASY